MSQESDQFVPKTTVLMIKDDSTKNGEQRSFQAKAESSVKSSWKTILIILLGILIISGISASIYGFTKTTEKKIDESKKNISVTTQNLTLIIKTTESTLITTADLEYSKIYSNVTENPSHINEATQYNIKTITDTTDDYDDYNETENSTVTTATEQNISSSFAKHPNYKNFPSKCGHQKSSTKIQHGNVTDLFEHPWIVAMHRYNKTGKYTSFFCGGSLLSDRIILTAGHCFGNSEDIEVSIVLGEYDLSNEFDCTEIDNVKECADSVQTFNASEFTTIIHPEYNKISGTHDIALIHLKRPATLSKSVAPICLPFNDEKIPNTIQVIGFGETEKFWKPNSNILMKANIKIVDSVNCNEMYKKHNTGRLVTENQFCAADNITIVKNNTSNTVFIDSCKGDSGSPALWPSVKSKVTQYGIISWGANFRCGALKPPGVYVKVYSYLDWILDTSEII